MSKIAIIAVLCIIGAALSKAEINKEELIKEFLENAENCRVEAGAQHADIEDMKNKKLASSKEGKCMRACVMKKYKVMDDQGKFVRSVAREHTAAIVNNDPAKMKVFDDIVDACEAKVKYTDDHCENAEAMAICGKEEATARGIEHVDI